MSGRAQQWIKRIAVVLGLVVLVGYVAVQLSFRSWRSSLHTQVRQNTNLISLSSGQIQYAFVGDRGPVILFFQGGSGGADQPFRLDGFRVLTPSRPGYLATDLAVGETLPEAARAYAALLDSLGIDRVAVIGLSAGGPSALEFAARYPERVSALVLISAVSKERPLPLQQRGFFSRITDRLIGEGFADWLLIQVLTRNPQLLLSDPESETMSVADLELLKSQPKRLPQLADSLSVKFSLTKQRLPGLVNDRIQYGRMGEPELPIHAPTLVIHGTADRDVGFDHAESATRRIPGAVLYSIEGSGHGAFYLRFDQIRPRLLEFLERHVGEAYSARGHGRFQRDPDGGPKEREITGPLHGRRQVRGPVKGLRTQEPPWPETRLGEAELEIGCLCRD